jgi:hypothetical protein
LPDGIADKDIYALLTAEYSRAETKEQRRLQATLNVPAQPVELGGQAPTNSAAAGGMRRLPRFIALCRKLGLTEPERRMLEAVFVHQVPTPTPPLSLSLFVSLSVSLSVSLFASISLV